MSHPLRQDERHGAEPLTRPHAAVRVRVDGDQLVVDGEVFIAKSDSTWFELPERLPVVAPDGRRIAPTPGRRFFVSAETFGPFHAVIEADRLPLCD